MEAEKSELDTLFEESKTAIQAAQSLGYITTEAVGGDLFDVLNEVAEGALKAEDTEDVVELRDRLHNIREISERVSLPFFGIGVSANEDGSIRLFSAD